MNHTLPALHALTPGEGVRRGEKLVGGSRKVHRVAQRVHECVREREREREREVLGKHGRYCMEGVSCRNV